MTLINGPQRKKICLQGFLTMQDSNLTKQHANNKGADQPVHQRSLVSASFVHSLERVIDKLAKRKRSSLTSLDHGVIHESIFK